MRWLRRTLLALVVWLTAAMAVVAGMPHWVCACPAPEQPATSPPKPPAARTCCCGDGRCLVGRDADSAEPPACCQHDDQQRTPPEPTGLRLERGACTFTVLPADDLICVFPGASASPLLADALLLELPAWSSYAEQVPAGKIFGQAHGCAPPADLITVLRHLLI